jgi:anaphase-promoting complex subunit 4
VKNKTADTNGATSSDPFSSLTSDNWNCRHDSASLDDFLERVHDLEKIEIPLHLSEQLARIDISSSMVKLPALPLLPPAAYKNGDHPAAELFSSQISLDAGLYSTGSHSINALEALLLAQDNGQIRLILYDALSIGNVSLPADWKSSKVSFRQCTSHPFSNTYMFLVDLPSTNGQTKTALVPLSLRFLHSSGSQLHLIESKIAQLEILVQYIGECLLAFHHHWKHANELPSRFMDGVNETLAEKTEPTLAQSLFHLAATGDCPDTLKEWLVDILAERVSVMCPQDFSC